MTPSTVFFFLKFTIFNTVYDCADKFQHRYVRRRRGRGRTSVRLQGRRPTFAHGEGRINAPRNRPQPPRDETF